MTQNGDLVNLDLTDEERRLLFYGLIDWGGPARCTEALAIALGFDGLEDLEREGHRIAQDIYDGRPVSLRDWTRAMFSAEIIFASDVTGTGSEWGVIQGGDDAHWLGVLRALQRKVPASRRYLSS